jgi:NAD(P)H-dependent flavin oxidoreductase YrpB (nitropropane dioxygenase family)
MMRMKPLVIGEKIAKLPIIQGGMGVGISLSGLAGAVARCGGVGVISSAQIGFLEEDFETNQKEANLRALKKHILRAKEGVTNGLVGVNIMTAIKDFEEHVRAAVDAGADLIISGAGLPISLPKLVENAATKIAPIVSSAKAAHVILALWDKKFHKTADMVVIEGPKAGGHLGFSREELAMVETMDYDNEIQQIIGVVKEYEEKYGHSIPVIVAGGIFDRVDVEHALDLGADGVQVASRFVATPECDADEAYKQAYLQAKAEDVAIIQSPVGMPGRAVCNTFIQRIQKEKEKITKCYQCLSHCKPAEVPYCITKALINAAKGNLEDGLIFCGANVGRIEEMKTVEALMQELTV